MIDLVFNDNTLKKYIMKKLFKIIKGFNISPRGAGFTFGQDISE